jgi:hypothetical protein
VPAEVEIDGPAGDAARSKVGQAAYDLNVQQYCCAGLNFGYYYDRSPAICYDGETPPPYGMGHFTASTVPGARAPHVWLSDGRSLLDALGPAYTLIRFDRAVDATPLVEAAARHGVPLTLVDVDKDKAGYGFAESLLMVRPDSHIAWRGMAAPHDPGLLFDRLLGIAEQSGATRHEHAVVAQS